MSTNTFMKTSKFEKAMGGFVKYGDKVLRIVKRREPEATFSMRFLVSCYANNVLPSIAAKTIISSHRDI